MDRCINRMDPPRSATLYNKGDRTLRTTTLLTAVPALCLYAVDNARFSYNSSPMANDNDIAVEILAMLFLSASILRFVWYSLSNIYYPHPHEKLWTSWPTVLIDLFFFIALLGLANTTLSIRTNPTICDQHVHGCASWLLSVNRAAGAMTILTAIHYNILFAASLDQRFRKRRCAVAEVTSEAASELHPAA